MLTGTWQALHLIKRCRTCGSGFMYGYRVLGGRHKEFMDDCLTRRVLGLLSFQKSFPLQLCREKLVSRQIGSMRKPSTYSMLTATFLPSGWLMLLESRTKILNCSNSYNDFWNLNYEAKSDRQELDESRTSEGFFTYWLLELTSRYKDNWITRCFALPYLQASSFSSYFRWGLRIPLSDAENGIEQAILCSQNILK